MGRQMLVADDSPAIRAVITDALEDYGVNGDHILVAENGKKAVEVYEAENPDVIFMDLNMPHVDGRDATRRILTEDPRAKIVAITGLGMDKDIVEEVRSIGAFAVLQKPLRFQDIQDVLTKIEEEYRGTNRIR